MFKNDVSSWSISSQLIVDEAKKRKYKVKIIDRDNNYFSITKGKKIEYFKSCGNSKISYLAYRITNDKHITNIVLNKYKLKTPKTFVVDNISKVKKNKIKFPCVTKPHDGAHGKGVSVNIKNNTDLLKGVKLATKDGSKCLIQELIFGNDYRLVVIGGKFVAGALRTPAFVCGDGKNNIKTLISIENKNKLRGTGDHNKPLSKIIIDKIVLNFLKEQKINLNNIPKNNEVVYLRKTANLSTGGSAENITKLVNKDIIKKIQKMAKEIGAGILAFDVFSDDISKPLEKNNGAVIEVSVLPGLRMHHFPSKGKSINVAGKILDTLF